ncbi:MAG: sigma-70 family RNA polymerase sigma factor [Candidatus Omnitrophica bacterium]|nr:sigma-70 family RNA polymerase sigma factor [Candidatus Omnitrophota bacterium]
MEESQYAKDYEFAQHCIKNSDFDEFYKRYKANIEKTIKKRLYGEMATYLEDISQEIIMYLLYKGGLGKYQGRSRLSTWLFVVVRGRTIDFIRNITRHKESSYDPVVLNGKAKKDRSVTRKLIEEETTSLVWKTLKEMRDTWNLQKTVFMEKHHLERLTYKQIGQMFNIKQTTVYNHILKAEDKFRELFSDLNPDYEEEQI